MTELQATTRPERPFLDWPVATDPSGWNGARVALLGIRHSEPYSHDSFPNDQSKAPDAIRRMSQSFCYNPAHWDFDLGTDLASHLPAHVDMGDVAFDGGDYSAYAAAITARARRLWQQGTQIIVLGGDHGVTIPVVDALDAVGAPVHILHIDAHLDWREEVGGVRRGYSSPLQWASKVKAVSGMTQIGLRAIGSARQKEVQAARAFGSHLIGAEQIHAEGMDPVLATIPEGPSGLPHDRCRRARPDGDARRHGADARRHLLPPARAAPARGCTAQSHRRHGHRRDRAFL